jgi:hypothetical protein
MEPNVIFRERHGLKAATIDGKSNFEMRHQVAKWLGELHGQQVFVYLQALDGTQTVHQLTALLNAAEVATNPDIACDPTSYDAAIQQLERETAPLSRWRRLLNWIKR